MNKELFNGGLVYFSDPYSFVQCADKCWMWIGGIGKEISSHSVITCSFEELPEQIKSVVLLDYLP